MGNCKVLSLHKHCLCLFLLFIIISFRSHLTSSAPSTAIPHPQQCHDLLQFKSNSVISDSASLVCYESSYPKTESWKESTDCCSSWDGVTCDGESGHVIGLDLSCSQLQGTIHSNSTLFSSHLAPHLKKLNLAFNDFQDSKIPPAFGIKFGSSLTHLNLSHSGFGGNIPPEMFLLSNIVSLDLSSSSSSSYYYYDYDYYPGLRVESDRVLERIAGNLTQLRILSLGGLNMSSIHASFLMSLSSSLTSLSLRGCELQGQFPASFLLRPNLQELDLGYNKFRFISTSLLHTTPSNNLTLLDLTDTDLSTSTGFLDFVGNHLISLRRLYLSSCNISGSIPPSFGNLLELTHLYTQENHLSGPIPPSLGNLTKLVVLSLHDNHLNGPIPTTFSNMPYLTDLKSLVLKENQLTGTIPQTLSYCHNLQILDVGHNMIQDTVPHWLETLSSLEVLVLRSNKFYGSLNSFNDKLLFPALRILDLSNNNFVGRFPFKLIKNLNAMTRVDESLEDDYRYMMVPLGREYYSMTIDVDANCIGFR